MSNKRIDLFKDREYEDMEWLNKAIEPFIFPFNEVLASLKDVYEVPYDVIYKHFLIDDNYTLDIEKLVMLANDIDISLSDIYFIDKVFEIHIAYGTTLDITNKKIIGSVNLVKTVSHIDDEQLKQIFSDKVYSTINSVTRKNETNIHRLNEVMDLINCINDRSSRSQKYKLRSISSRYKEIIANDEWKIRDTTLILKCANWICDYLNHGNLAALSNLTKLKCMTHINNGSPIYSIEETV